MNDNLYSEALSHFNKGEYEEALSVLTGSDVKLSSAESRLIDECRKQITEQYYYLINERIQQEDYLTANAIRKKYYAKYGLSPKIEKINIPEMNGESHFQDVDSEDSSKEASYRLWLIIGGAVIVGFIIYIWQHNRPDDYVSLPVDSIDASVPAVIQHNASEQSNRFEYIKEARGNFKVDIEYPLSLEGIADLTELQLLIAEKAFGSNNKDIHSCVENYFREGEESPSLGTGETFGEITVKYQRRIKDFYIFEIHTYADLGGGTGLSVINRNEYVYFNGLTERPLRINDMFTEYSKALSIVNEHISLDEYSSKAKELPDNFSLSATGITFVFPKYSIGYGFQGEVEITVTYDELDSVLSETFKSAIDRN